MVTAPPPAIYQQFDQVEPPQRFLAIIKAYMELIQSSDTSWSYRKLSEQINVSHSYFTNLDARLKEGTGKPNQLTVQAIVSVINEHVSGAQLWPLEHAMIAAGHKVSSVRPALPSRGKNAFPEPRHNDTLPLTGSRIPAPIIDLQ